MTTLKQEPKRTCIVCRETRNKRQLVRIVYAGRLEVDPKGRKPGRGAYLCPNPECWTGALGKGRLEHALKIKVTQADRQVIEDYARSLAGQVSSGS